MVERMKYVTVMGPMDGLDHAVEAYLSRYDIQLEHATRELPREKGLTPLPLNNPYSGTLRVAEKLIRMTGLEKLANDGKRVVMGKQQAISIVEFAESHFDKIAGRTKELEVRRSACAEVLEKLEPFRSLNVRVEALGRFKHIGYQFGKIPLAGYRQYETFLHNDSEVILLTGKTDEEYVWCVYFAVAQTREKVDSLFSSFHFEMLDMPTAVNGKPLAGKLDDVCAALHAEIDELAEKIAAESLALITQLKMGQDAEMTKRELAAAYKVVRDLEFYYDVRRFAARTRNGFYIFIGWMTERDAERMHDEAAEDKAVVVVASDGRRSAAESKPPTKLRNSVIFRPFEFFVDMYGLPSYGEMDPTVFVGLTYSLLFGIMFGDLGQGLLLCLLGFGLWKARNFALGKVLMVVGLSSAVFGAAFGSVFGFEHLIEPLLIRPAENAITMLLATVFLGVAFMALPMALNIINALKQGKTLKAVFDPNGIAGLYLYVVIVVAAACILMDLAAISIGVVAALVAIPFVMILFREVFEHLLAKNKEEGHEKPKAAEAKADEAAETGAIEKEERKEGVVMTLVQMVIEMFEVMLSYFVNTVSFVRVGAFALSHASMMGVVMMLAGAERGSHNPVVIVFGNILVIGLEGLVVGIQVLRLEFYEMFSRFYEGAGRKFAPYKINYK